MYRPNPGANQSAPIYSETGQRFRAAVLGAPAPRSMPQTAAKPWQGIGDAVGRVVRQQLPLYKAPGFRDRIGAFVLRPPSPRTVVGAMRYQGQLPMEQQPKLAKADAWNDPSRGAP